MATSDSVTDGAEQINRVVMQTNIIHPLFMWQWCRFMWPSSGAAWGCLHRVRSFRLALDESVSFTFISCRRLKKNERRLDEIEHTSMVRCSVSCTTKSFRPVQLQRETEHHP